MLQHIKKNTGLDYWRNIMGIDRTTVRVIFFAQQQNLVSRIADSSRPGEWTGLRQRFGSIPFSIWDMISLRWSSFSREWSRGVRNSHRNVQNLISECFVAISEMNRLATLCTPAQTEDITHSTDPTTDITMLELKCMLHFGQRRVCKILDILINKHCLLIRFRFSSTSRNNLPVYR